MKTLLFILILSALSQKSMACSEIRTALKQKRQQVSQAMSLYLNCSKDYTPVKRQEGLLRHRLNATQLKLNRVMNRHKALLLSGKQKSPEALSLVDKQIALESLKADQEARLLDFLRVSRLKTANYQYSRRKYYELKSQIQILKEELSICAPSKGPRNVLMSGKPW